jgi:hypothetical protein
MSIYSQSTAVRLDSFKNTEHIDRRMGVHRCAFCMIGYNPDLIGFDKNMTWLRRD